MQVRRINATEVRAVLLGDELKKVILDHVFKEAGLDPNAPNIRVAYRESTYQRGSMETDGTKIAVEITVDHTLDILPATPGGSA